MVDRISIRMISQPKCWIVEYIYTCRVSVIFRGPLFCHRIDMAVKCLVTLLRISGLKIKFDTSVVIVSYPFFLLSVG